jgi:hypothetical protein
VVPPDGRLQIGCRLQVEDCRLAWQPWAYGHTAQWTTRWLRSSGRNSMLLIQHWSGSRARESPTRPHAHARTRREAARQDHDVGA